MKELIRYEKSFMPKADAELISAYASKYDDLFNHFGNNEKEFTVHTHEEISSRDQSALDLINYHARRVYDFVCENYPGPFLDFDESKTHIARFEEGRGMHKHFDASKPNDIATLIYLNNNYSGGEVFFPDHDISIKPEAGDLVCFPDTPDFVHGVNPIISGIRYTTPRWFTRIV
jgi:hypothetical protein